MGKLLDVLPGRLRTLLAFGIAVVVFAAAGYVLITVLAQVSSLVLATAAAILLSALLTPLVNALVRVRLHRGLAALVAVVALVAAIGAIGTVFALGITRELDSLRSDLAIGADRIRDWLVNGPLGISQEQVDRATAAIREQVRGIVPRLLRGATSILEAVGMGLLTLVLLFFLLRDGRSMVRWFLSGLSDRNRDCANRAADAGWKALQGYVRGSAIVAAVDATGIGIGLFILGVPLALPLALITFLFSFIPLVGATTAGALAVLVALAARGPVIALLALGVVLVVQNVEGNLLEPVVMGRAVRLHPAVILVVIAAGALVAGVGGALLATPLTAMTYRIAGVLKDCPGRPEPPEPVSGPPRRSPP